ncbi:MAG: hypothetical protein VB047_10885 [Anaerotignum propionicum]|uniref:hypothetical protein n=1 Tax=Anaerotignum propionicum TaxID=28446 RepID=UPI002B20CA88|nr:hypothetical protein [Anaerotignum propionicum]MEA5058048.1 hypothetical protein [Anaerotignum propionicum]
MNKYCLVLDEFVSHKMCAEIGYKAGLQVLVGRMESTDCKSEFDTLKKLFEDLLTNFVAEEFVSEGDCAIALYILETCRFEDDEDEEEDDGSTLSFYKTTIDQANELLKDGILHLLNPTYEAGNEDVQSGIDFTFRFETIGGGFRFRNLLVKTDGTVHISKEY